MKLPDPSIVARIYDEDHLGAASYRDVLSQEECEKLLEEITRMELTPPSYVAGIVQNMTTQYYARDEFSQLRTFSCLSALVGAYQAFYSQLGEQASFCGEINSVGIHHYPQSDEGIGKHRDYLHSINLVSILVLAGKAPFFAYNNKERELSATPGSLILLRANRHDGEDIRPPHRVGPVAKERYVLCLREDG